jgi:hypothetical protein
MNPLLVPWIAAAAGIAFLTFKGFRAKREYLRHKTNISTQEVLEKALENLKEEERRKALEEQGQMPLIAGMRR